MERGAAIMQDEIVATQALRDRKAGRTKVNRNAAVPDKAVHFSAETPLKNVPQASVPQPGEVDGNSVAPELSVDASGAMERRIAEVEKVYLESRKVDAAVSTEVEKRSTAEQKAISETMPTSGMRHQKAFDRLKGSSAMGQLLKADDAVLKRARKISGTLRGQPKQQRGRREVSHGITTSQPVRHTQSLQERELRQQ
jgi:hypothetical protein